MLVMLDQRARGGRAAAPQRSPGAASISCLFGGRCLRACLDSSDHCFVTDPPDAAAVLADEWDERYTSLADRIPDVEPNAVLITEAGALRPGGALDIGCGVGAEAIWLATHGWNVTALDVSRAALEHAAHRARQAAVDVQWVQARLEDAPVAACGFDLVTAFYPALRHSDAREAEQALVSAVAPHGILLVVHHADVDAERAKAHGFDPADYLSRDDIVELLSDDWDVRIHRRRPREVPAGPEGQHTHDDVLVARRQR